MRGEPEDKNSSNWKSWALMQVGPSGRPLYGMVDGEIRPYGEIEMPILLARYGR